jgi:hypothetical protein
MLQSVFQRAVEWQPPDGNPVRPRPDRPDRRPEGGRGDASRISPDAIGSATLD